MCAMPHETAPYTLSFPYSCVSRPSRSNCARVSPSNTGVAADVPTEKRARKRRWYAKSPIGILSVSLFIQRLPRLCIRVIIVLHSSPSAITISLPLLLLLPFDASNESAKLPSHGLHMLELSNCTARALLTIQFSENLKIGTQEQEM